MTTILERTIAIIFEGDDRTQTAFQGVKKNFDEFDMAVQGVAGPLAGVADNILKFQAVLAGLSAGALTYSVGVFSDYEDVMLKVKGVIWANAEEYKQLTDLTKELGQTTRFTATEASQGLEFLALAGFKTSDALGSLPIVLRLAQASAMDLGGAADIVTNIMAGYGIEVENLESASDVLTATFTNSNTSLGQLGQAFKYAGPVAKSLGLEISETSSILGILGNAGYQAEMGGTALRNILLALIAPMGNAGKLMKELGVDTEGLGVDLASSATALKSLGVEVKGADGNLRPFADILADMKSGLEKIQDPADRTAILIEIFGKRGGPQMAALLEQGADAVRGLESKINSLGGVTKKVADEMESGIGGSIRMIKSAFESMATELGEETAKKIKSGTDGITELFRTIAKEIDAGSFDRLFGLIGDLSDEIGEALANIAENLPEALDDVDFDGFIDSVIGLKDEIVALFDDIDISTPEGLAGALQFAVDSISTLISVTKGMVGSLQPVIDSFSDLQRRANETGSTVAEDIGKILGAAKLLAEAGTFLGGFLIAIQTTGTDANRVFEVVTGSVKALYNTAQAMMDFLVGAMSSWFGTVTGVMSDLSGYIPGLDGVSEKLSGLSDGLKKLGDAAMETHFENVEQMMEGVGKVAVGVTGEVKKVKGAIDDLPDNKETAIDVDTKQAGISLDDLQKQISKGHEFVVTTNVDDTAVQEFADKPLEKNVDVKADADTDSFNRASDIITEILPDGSRKFTYVGEVDQPALKKAADDINKNIPDEKRLKIETELEMARIDADTKKIEAMLDFKAKVDVAEIEAATERIKAAFESAGETIGSTGDVISGIFSDIGDFMGKDATSSQLRNALLTQLEKENEYRERALVLQEELTKAQVEYMDARRRALERGAPLIQIEASNLAPALEMIFINILELCQVRATEEGLEALIGL